jgi:hypothetical protein
MMAMLKKMYHCFASHLKRLDTDLLIIKFRFKNDPMAQTTPPLTLIK